MIMLGPQHDGNLMKLKNEYIWKRFDFYNLINKIKNSNSFNEIGIRNIEIVLGSF